MSAGDKSSFVSAVVSNGIDKVGGDLLVSWRRTSTMSEILECPEGLGHSDSKIRVQKPEDAVQVQL